MVRPDDIVHRAGVILFLLKKKYPDPQVGFSYTSPFKILVSTMLSAQTTDVRTARVCEMLFSRFPSAVHMVKADRSELETIIRPLGLYRRKTDNLMKISGVLLEAYDGEVPSTMDELLSLPGVGRKTANLVLSLAFGMNVGIAVDTHVFRISKRLGLACGNGREKVEGELLKLFSKDDYLSINTYFIIHGRACCVARTPVCECCPLQENCDYFLND